jgi:hypothetical protein
MIALKSFVSPATRFAAASWSAMDAEVSCNKTSDEGCANQEE